MYTVFDSSDLFFKTKGSVQELAPIVAKYGIGGINPPAALLENCKAAREAAVVVRDLGLKWGLMPTPADFLVPDTTDEMFDQGIEKLKTWADTAQKMGVKYSYNHVCPGSNEWEFDENFERHVIRVGKINRIMRDNGIHYGLEFIGPKHVRDSFKHEFVYTLSGILAIADEVGPEVGFLFDTYHWFCGSSKLDDIYYAARHVDRMVCFHMNDGIAGKSRLEQEDMTRAMPMTTGVIDAVYPYRLFRARGYTGPVLCEPMFPTYSRFPNMKPEAVVREVAESYCRVEKLADN